MRKPLHAAVAPQVDLQEQRSGVKAEKQLAPVLDNSVAWGSFVAVSSNSRYQIIAGIEERVLVSNHINQ